jgi:hypothetical protein
MVSTRLISKASAFVDAINVKNPTYGATGDGSTDDTTALQSAINAAIAANKPLFVPTGRYYNTGLTINGNLSIVGGGVTGNWVGTPNALPSVSPYLLGSVFLCASNGSNAFTVDPTKPQLQINLVNIGIEFATPFVGTGHGYNHTPAQDVKGLTGSYWENVMVYGHDGDHYAFNLVNPAVGGWYSISSFGGGMLKMYGNSTFINFGNMLFDQLFSYVLVGGSADAINLSASAAQRLNLCAFIRPTILVTNITGVSPAGNPPTSAQAVWREDANIYNVKKVALDLETTVSSPLVMGGLPINGNDWDWPSCFTNGVLSSPAWGSKGRFFNVPGPTIKDTTSSGATGDTALNSFNGTTVTATNAATYSVLATVYITPPIQGTNVTATKLRAIYATGSIETTGSMSCVGLTSSSGNVNLFSTVGVGKNAISSSFLAVAAGSTTRSALNLASGVAPTSPADGDIWYDGTNLNFRLGGTTKTFTLA